MKQITCPHCADTYPDSDAAHVCSRGPYAPRLKPKMNERFKQLAEQAQIGLFEDKSFGWSVIAGTDQHLSKFAELIVRECIDIVEQDMKLAHIQMIPLTLEKYANGRLKEKIREHFGVEQ